MRFVYFIKTFLKTKRLLCKHTTFYIRDILVLHAFDICEFVIKSNQPLKAPRKYTIFDVGIK